MYYSSGNYEAFARPKKPDNIEQKSAYLVGAGLASLAAAAFLIRDGQMKGKEIHVLEELSLPGGSLDGIFNPEDGFIIRGGREMENHFECLWDLYRSIPSLEEENASVLDEFYWLNKEDPNSSNCRMIYDRGQRVPDDGAFTLGESARELIKLVLTPEESLTDKKIEDVFSSKFFTSNFWYYWCTMFAFEKWHSAVEMRRYVMRFIHHIKGLPDFTALKFTRYNQYESLVLPLVSYLKDQGVDFQYKTTVTNIIVEVEDGKKVAKSIQLKKAGLEKELSLTEDDLIFVTNGSITESTTHGSHDSPAPINNRLGGSWKLWQNLAKQSTEFGHPEVFCEDLPSKSWFISATMTLQNADIEPYIERLTHREIHSGKIVTGGIVTIKDSNWLMSFAVHRQPHFKAQKPNQTTVWIYGLYSDTLGNYIQKKIVDCSGEEIAEELLYHLGIPETKIKRYAQNSCTVVPTYMPFITSYFMVRHLGDRPLVVPDGCVNLAFIGNFAETKRDTVFTTEYSVRTAMEAVYTLLNIDRAVPEVFGSVYDIRQLLSALYYLNDEKKLTELNLPIPKLFLKLGLKKCKGTYLEELLKEAHLL
ncbi:oleate hydratase [Liquorilactobacillus oeni]|uniref:Myosin-cross-reactive antigen n=1 Tax=Liquorilactobacillus oeni DSM 19972 TaxID=1423777 RepID=A0A0R1M7Y9_9LACO|nr:oleate hydratase [Liquorilactobacillus oeni]KRL04461.1 myosin-cross-reactive antigen [Liquorilactobacillus oeni DSM 19972]